jgi:hypothetical protein
VKFEPNVVSEYSAIDLDRTVKIVGVSEGYDLVAKCEQGLSKLLENRASAKRSQPYYVDVTQPQANKGAVVDEFRKLLGIPGTKLPLSATCRPTCRCSAAQASVLPWECGARMWMDRTRLRGYAARLAEVAKLVSSCTGPGPDGTLSWTILGAAAR